MGKQPGCDPTAMKNLRELKALYDEGVLSESEYASEKSKHMDKLWPRPPLPDAPAPKRKRGPRKKAPKKDATEAEAPPPPVAEAPGGTTSVAFDSAKALGVELEYDGAAKLVRLTLAQPESAARDVAPGSVLVAINGEPLELPEVCLGEDHLSLARKKVIAAKGEGSTVILDFQDA